MSRTGGTLRQAMVESFFATLKTECATHRFASQAQACATLFDYIEVWYSRQQPPSSLNYRRPAAFEQLHAA